MLHALANRVHYSKAYSIFYFLMIIISTMMLFWTFFTGGMPHGKGGITRDVYIGLDILVTVMIVSEVLIRIAAYGSRFFDNKWNKLDLALACLCILTPFLYLSGDNVSSIVLFEEDLELLLLILRYILPFIRLFIWIKNNRRRYDRNATIGAIDFGILDEEFDEIEIVTSIRTPSSEITTQTINRSNNNTVIKSRGSDNMNDDTPLL